MLRLIEVDCPEENTIAGFVQGLLPPVEAKQVESHVDSCAMCTALMSELGRLAVVSPAGVQTPAEPPPSEQIADRYVFERTIGRGGMGEVQLAVDPVLNRWVAIKTIRSDCLAGSNTTEAKERLIREARAMAALRHPNVVAVHDAGIHQGEVFLAMEYVEGLTLAHWLTLEEQDWRTIADHFLAAGRGVAAAHGAGILHRDFKPQNVLVGNDGRVLVTDFGLARIQHVAAAPNGASSAELTQHGAVLGTPAYMAPEQLWGQPIDVRSDIFSFCVALYEALFGVRPFQAPTLEGLRSQMSQGTLHPPVKGRRVPQALRRVIAQGLAVAPHERPGSMRELLAAIEQSSGGELHVRINMWCQGVFTVVHIGLAILFAYHTYTSNELLAPSSSSTSSSGDGSDAVIIFIVLWAVWAVVFIFSGPFWALLNTIGLAYRRPWARITTILYAIGATMTCAGIPYGIYALWSMTRDQVKRTLTR